MVIGTVENEVGKWNGQYRGEGVCVCVCVDVDVCVCVCVLGPAVLNKEGFREKVLFE